MDLLLTACPAKFTTAPSSLTNLQVSVGGQHVLQSTLNINYEHFLEQVNLAEQLTSSEMGRFNPSRILEKQQLENLLFFQYPL